MIGDRALVSPRGISCESPAPRRPNSLWSVGSGDRGHRRAGALLRGRVRSTRRARRCVLRRRRGSALSTRPTCSRTSSPCSSSASSSRCTGSRPSSARRPCARTSSSASWEAASSTRCSGRSLRTSRHERWAEYERLPDLYRSAGCALGIFGASAKPHGSSRTRRSRLWPRKRRSSPQIRRPRGVARGRT